jgi:glycosyltransferase involved in cell wall biosynthesis
MLTLTKYFSPAVSVTGIITWDIDGVLAAEARRYTRLFWPYESIQFLSECDVLLAWGLPELSKLAGIGSFKGKVIGCSHGTSLQPFHRKTNADMASIPGCLMTAVSDAAARSFPDGSDVTVIPNGVELERCAPRHGREKVRESLGLGPGDKMALFLSRLGREKRPGLLAEAVLRPGMENWTAVIGGYDIEGEGAKLPRHPRVKHIQPVDSPGDLLSAADVFILPSNAEAHPLALTEAWIAGVPTVYCDWPFAGQIRRDHGTDLGIVVPVDLSAVTLAWAITESQTDFMANISHRARKVAWENYTASAMAARWEKYMGVPSEICEPVTWEKPSP